MLEELYKLYLDNGIISDAISYDMFSQSNEQQQQGLYDLGVAQGLFETTDLNTFKTAWSQKKRTPRTRWGISIGSWHFGATRITDNSKNPNRRD